MCYLCITVNHKTTLPNAQRASFTKTRVCLHVDTMSTSAHQASLQRQALGHVTTREPVTGMLRRMEWGWGWMGGGGGGGLTLEAPALEVDTLQLCNPGRVTVRNVV